MILISRKPGTQECKISELEEKGTHISCTANSIDCVYDAERKVISTICPSHMINLVGFRESILNLRTVHVYSLRKTKVVSTANI